MSGNQQKSPHEEMILFFVVIGLVCGISWIVWSAFHAELTSFVRWVRYGEMRIVQLYNPDYSIADPVYGTQRLSRWVKWLPNANPNTLGINEITMMTRLAVYPLRYLFIGILLVFALWAIFFAQGTKFRRRMSLEDLLREQAKMFPVVAPFVKFNPAKMKFRVIGDPVPAVLPLFAEALSPAEWVAYNDIPFQGGKLDYPKAYDALYKQLGGRWRGALHLPLHMQGLFAAFALKHVRRRDESDAILNEMAVSWSADKGFNPPSKLKSKIRKVLKDEKVGRKLEKTCNKHAYETTAMLRALQRAREEGGVLAPAQFLWLRGHDRALWYPLNNLGRRSYHAEAAGAMSHYTYELIASQRIPMPRFDEVVRVLEQNLTGPAGQAIPKLDRSAKADRFWAKK